MLGVILTNAVLFFMSMTAIPLAKKTFATKNTTNSGKVKMKALDIFCGVGGASMGLNRAGFSVVGVYIRS